MSEPRILAIETSSTTGSVAVALGPTLLASQTLPSTTRHAAELMPAIQALTRQQNWKPSDIDHVYLSLGPGSFTGLRIAVAIARALHQATGCKLIGVPSLDVIAQNAPKEFHTVIPMLDAKRNQVFAAQYKRGEHGTLVQVLSPALVDPATFIQRALEQNAKLAVLGQALTHFHPAPHPNLTLLPPDFWQPTAQTVHRLGFHLAQQNQFADPQTLLPLYIRLPEAEEVYRKKHNLPL